MRSQIDSTGPQITFDTLPAWDEFVAGPVEYSPTAPEVGGIVHSMFPYVPYRRIRTHRHHRIDRFRVALAVVALVVIVSIGLGTWAILLR
jgi:hypothetical protein